MQHPIDRLRELEQEIYNLAYIGGLLDRFIKREGKGDTPYKRAAKEELVRVDERLERTRAEYDQLNSDYFYVLRRAERDEKVASIAPPRPTVTFFGIDETEKAAAA